MKNYIQNTQKKYYSDRNMYLRVVTEANLNNVNSFKKNVFKDKLMEL